MSQHRFEGLRERLLRAGVAPRHIRRFLRELGDHHDDAVRAELANGASPAAAHEAAWARLGSADSLAQGMLDRPELRSKAARFPALVFGVLPVLSWLAAPFAVAAALSLLLEARRHLGIAPTFVVDALRALSFLHTRVLPVLLGAAALEVAARRRLRTAWPLVGAGAVDVLAGTVTVYVAPGHLSVSSSLLPWLAPFSTLFGPREAAVLGHGLLWAACLVALSLIAQRLLRRLGLSDKPRLCAE